MYMLGEAGSAQDLVDSEHSRAVSIVMIPLYCPDAPKSFFVFTQQNFICVYVRTNNAFFPGASRYRQNNTSAVVIGNKVQILCYCTEVVFFE